MHWCVYKSIFIKPAEIKVNKMQDQINELAEQCGVSAITVKELAESLASKLDKWFSIHEMLLEVKIQAEKHHNMSTSVLEGWQELESCKIASHGGVTCLSDQARSYLNFQSAVYHFLSK